MVLLGSLVVMALTIHGQKLGGGSLVVALRWALSSRGFVIW